MLIVHGFRRGLWLINWCDERLFIIYDLIYNPAPTSLLKFSAKKGCMTIDGLQMLIAQGLKSLSFWTNGLEVPFHIMNDALKNYLKNK